MSATAIAETLRLGPETNGMLLTPEEFDAASFAAGWSYELYHGVLIVTPPPSPEERDPNDELGHLIRQYRKSSPHGATLDVTLPEQTVRTSFGRRRADRVIWAGLGRLPTEDDPPTIVIELVSSGRRNRQRDYDEKSREYLEIGVQEYWIIDRFAQTMTVISGTQEKPKTRVLPATDRYTTPLLPGFELPLAELFAIANRWNEPTGQ